MQPDRPRPRRTVLRLVGLGAVVAGAAPVLACAAPRPSGPASDLRSALASGLRANDPTTAELVAGPTTTLDLVATPWLPGWRVVDAQSRTLPHPRRVYAALADDGTAAVLSGRPEVFTALVAAARPGVDRADTARAVAETLLDVTRSFRQWAYRVARFDEIEFLPNPGATARRERDRLRRTYGPAVDEQSVVRSGDGWLTTLWMVDGRDLVEHVVDVGPDGTVRDQPTTRVRDLPVPWSR